MPLDARQVVYFAADERTELRKSASRRGTTASELMRQLAADAGHIGNARTNARTSAEDEVEP